MIFDCPLSELEVDEDVLQRCAAELTPIFFAETEPPPISVYRNGNRWHVTDGYHRIAAALKMGKTHLKANEVVKEK